MHPVLRFLAILHWGLLTPTAGWVLLFEQLAQHHHATAWTTGLILACCGLGNIVGSLLAGPLLKSFRVGQIFFVTIWLWVLSWLPDHLQGRVNSIIHLLVNGSMPLGIVLTGLLIQLIGPVGSVLAIFAPQLLLAVIMTFFYRRLVALS